jgi:hypothetical protein
MQVTITRIEDDEVDMRVAGREHTVGFWAAFTSPLTAGSAIFAGDKNNYSPGSTLNVETDFERISNWRILPHPSSRRLDPLIDRGDYQVTGVVNMRWEDGVVNIDAGLSFMVDTDLDVARDTVPEVDQWVAFNVHRLVLFPY